MKYLKKFEEHWSEFVPLIGGVFGEKDASKHIDEIIDIIKDENIIINKDFEGGGAAKFSFVIDGVKYNIESTNGNYLILTPEYFMSIDGKEHKISMSDFRKIKKLYNETHKKIDKADEFPDLSDLGRAAKKYNL